MVYRDIFIRGAGIRCGDGDDVDGRLTAGEASSAGQDIAGQESDGTGKSCSSPFVHIRFDQADAPGTRHAYAFLDLLRRRRAGLTPAAVGSVICQFARGDQAPDLGRIEQSVSARAGTSLLYTLSSRSA